MKKDYSYIKIGYKFPVSNIKCLSEEYSRRDAPNTSHPQGCLRHYVKCECPFCKSEFEGRLDRLEFNPKTQEGPRTLCCKSCSFTHTHNRPFKDPWRWNGKEKKGINIDRTENLEGKIFKNMLVLAPELGMTDIYGNAWWLCECLLCGNKELVRGNALRGTDGKYSHGKYACSKCLKSISNGEQAVESWFKKNNIINYIHHVKFSDLRGVGGRMLDFDFGIGDIEKEQYQYLIEFQGAQHYKSISYFGGKEQFKKQEEHDNRKRQWCKEHNIKLIEIPYNYKNLDDYLNQILVN